MEKYNVELTCIYNGSVVIDADNDAEALNKAQELLYGFPGSIEIPNGSFSFGEATADYAQLINY